MKTRYVYIGGTLGWIPAVVATTMRQAIRETVKEHRMPDDINDHGYPERWTCELIDSWILRCTLTITEPDGETQTLYVEQIELKDDGGYMDGETDGDP